MRSERGQTLLELVVVIAVSVMVVGALVFATISSLRNAQFAKNQAQATKLAQEGIERVRTGRDRNRNISILGVTSVDSWSGANPIWGYPISSGSNPCESAIVDPVTSASVLRKCYFKVDSAGVLINIGFAQQDFPKETAEAIPPLPDPPIFKRAITLSDDATTYATQKTVTAIVTWTDFSGSHESRLTTILRKI